AESLPGVTIRFSTEMESFEQDDRCVTVVLRDLAGGRVERISCDYLVGADGARSRVRDAIGAQTEGRRGLSRNYNLVFGAAALTSGWRASCWRTGIATVAYSWPAMPVICILRSAAMG